MEGEQIVKLQEKRSELVLSYIAEYTFDFPSRTPETGKKVEKTILMILSVFEKL